MEKKKPVVIDVTDYRVTEGNRREPIIKSWGNLIWLLAPIAVVFVIRYAQIKGWL